MAEYVCLAFLHVALLDIFHFYCSKSRQLEEELHVITNTLKSLEISENKVSLYIVSTCPRVTP